MLALSLPLAVTATNSVPTNAASRLALLTPTNSPDGLVLMWQSSPNRSCFLQRATNNAGPFNFLPLATNLIGQPGATEYTDMTVGGGPATTAWASSRSYLTSSNAKPFRYSVSGIMGMIG